VFIFEVALARLSQRNREAESRITDISYANCHALINDVYPSALSRVGIVDEAFQITTQATRKLSQLSQ